jgi:hypothetical protein
MTENQTPAGWYPDPSGDTTKTRYWDGNAWTNDYQDAQAAAQSTTAAGYAATATGTVPGAAQTPGATGAYNPYAATGQPIAAPANDKAGLAIAALVVGIVGIPGGICLPILGYILGAVAIVLGSLGMKGSKKTLAVVGLILGIVTVVISLINSILGVLMFSSYF